MSDALVLVKYESKTVFQNGFVDAGRSRVQFHVIDVIDGNVVVVVDYVRNTSIALGEKLRIPIKRVNGWWGAEVSAA